jgi:hypothetical protein
MAKHRDPSGRLALVTAVLVLVAALVQLTVAVLHLIGY